MKLLTAFFSVAGVLLLQTMVVDRFSWMQAADLFLLMNIYYALNFAPVPCMILAVASGFLQDSFSHGVLGMNAFSKMIVAYLIATISSRVMIKHPMIILVLVGICTMLDFLIVIGLYQIFSLSGWSVSPRMILTAAVLNMILGFAGFHIADRIRVQKEYL